MGEQTIIHGRIAVKKDLDKARAFLVTLKNDSHYPWIRSEMFSLGSDERPYYYDEPIISFGASYKGLEHSLQSFIVKFEYLLVNIDFDTASLKMETEFYGSYQFYWKSKNQGDKFEPKEKLFSTQHWYFGLGNRSVWGTLTNSYSEMDIPPFDFVYPVLSNKGDFETSSHVVTAVQNSELGRKIYIRDLDLAIDDKNLIFPILNFYEVRKELEYGLEPKKGYWFIRRQNQLTSISSIQNVE